MANKITNKKVVLEGIANWAKVFSSNRDLEGYKGAFKEYNGATTIELVLDNDNWDKLKRSGSMKRGRPVDGGTAVKLERKWETGKDWDSGAPEVLKADGNPWDVDVDGFIGNGSKVRVMAVVTDFPDKGVSSTRLEMVKVLEHVPYEGVDDQFRKDETGGQGQPKASRSADADEGVASKPSHNASTRDIDDEIPFDRG
jgi:hypothetical protein